MPNALITGVKTLLIVQFVERIWSMSVEIQKDTQYFHYEHEFKRDKKLLLPNILLTLNIF